MDGVYVDVLRSVGDRVQKHLTVGVIRISSVDIYSLCEKLKCINELLVIEDSEGNNLLIRFDNYQELIDEYINGRRECNEI